MQQKQSNGKKDTKLKQIYLRISSDLPSLNKKMEIGNPATMQMIPIDG